MTAFSAPGGAPRRDEAGGSGPGGSLLPATAAASDLRSPEAAALNASPESLGGGSGEAATDPLGGGPVIVTVIGRAAPQGSKRHLGKGVMVESSQRVKPWREAVKQAVYAFRAAAGLTDYRFPQGVPLYVEVIFVFDKPKSAPKTRRAWPTTRSSGDIDKLQRSTFDALTDAGLIWDDSQIVQVLARKAHTDDPDAPLAIPGAVIAITEAA